jgi:hypothetical protein
MPKASQGRFDGVWGMRTFAADELFAWADKYEARITDPLNTDDPKWLQRRANRLRRTTAAKEDACENKRRQPPPGRAR